MKKIIRVIVLLGLSIPLLTFAAGQTNPVSYSVSPSSGFPTPTYIGSSYAVVYTITNNLPFPTVVNITHSVTGSGGFSVADACSGHTLAAHASCLVHITSQPTAAGSDSIQLTLNYDRNVVPLPALTSTVQPVAVDDVDGVVTDPLNPHTVVGTGYSFVFTFTNIGNVAITPSSVPVTPSNGVLSAVTNNCTGTTQPNESCTISGTFTPSAEGPDSVSANFIYDGGKQFPLVTQSTATTSGGGFLKGVSFLKLPTTTYQYADNVVKFVFTNEHDTLGMQLGQVTLSGKIGSTEIPSPKAGQPTINTWINPGTDQCSGKTLALNSSCSVYASIVPQTTGSNLTIKASVPYSINGQQETATASTSSTTVKANSTDKRTITVVNQCPFTVWMSFQGGAEPNSPTCTANPGVCEPGTTCNTSADGGLGLCYFTNPSLDGAHPNGRLLPDVGGKPDAMDIFVSQTNAGSNPINNIIFNSGIVARRHCTGNGTSLFCTENNCGSTIEAADSTGPDGMCLPGTTASNYPDITFNAAELTFNLLNNYGGAPQADGVVDEKTINGVNVPVEIKGRGPMNTTQPPTNPPYDNCQAAGAVIQPTTGSATSQLGLCSYNYVPPTVAPDGTVVDQSNSRFVIPSTSLTTCTSSSACTSPEVCGLGLDPATQKINKYCGELAGYISIDTAFCSHSESDFEGNAAGQRAHYLCDKTYTLDGKSYTGTDLFAGSLPSAYDYTSVPPTYVTGCVDWWKPEGGNLVVPTNTESCVKNGVAYINPNWTGVVQPQIQYVKNACPTAYAYQYDDPTTNMQCTVSNGNQIVTNYQVTFCPGGATLLNPYPTA